MCTIFLSQGQAPRRTRLGRGAGAGAVNLSACPISRTPRGVPLMISPLSQFEDRFLGSICGPSSSSMSVSAPSASSNIDATGIANMANMFSSNNHGGMGQASASSLLVYPTPNIPPLPPSLLMAEDAVMERCRLQSMAAAAANKIKRLRLANSDWSKQVNDVQLSLQKCTNFFAQAARDDVVESKIIRRELLTYGIVTAKDTVIHIILFSQTLDMWTHVTFQCMLICLLPSQSTTHHYYHFINSPHCCLLMYTPPPPPPHY